jgi:hypothetical protein
MTPVWPLYEAFSGRSAKLAGTDLQALSLYRLAARTGGYGWPARSPVDENSRQLPSFLMRSLWHLHKAFFPVQTIERLLVARR